MFGKLFYLIRRIRLHIHHHGMKTKIHAGYAGGLSRMFFNCCSQRITFLLRNKVNNGCRPSDCCRLCCFKQSSPERAKMSMLIHASWENVLAGCINHIIGQLIQVLPNGHYGFPINQNVSLKFGFRSQNCTIFYQLHSMSL